MKKTLYTIALALLAVTGCRKEDFTPAGNDGTVEVCFDIRMPEAVCVTKTLAENPDLRTLHVAVFDGNGYKVNFTEATALSQIDAKTWRYSVKLVSTDEPRILHFLGNCPEEAVTDITENYGNEMTLLADIVCEKGHDAYWQKKVLSNGIPENENEARSAIGAVELIRNYSKIKVTCTAENFTLDGIAAYDFPDKAYLAPYMSSGAKAGQFVENYGSLSYDDIIVSYTGRTPKGITLNTFSSSDTLIPAVDGEADAYLFETPLDSPTPYVIIGGYYRGDDAINKTTGDYCYYKINIKDLDGKDYAMLRNFSFSINVLSVAAKGYDTMEEANSSAGSGDICSLTSFENATNISDTFSQLFVSTMSVTVVDQSTIKIRYRFIPDVKNAVNTQNNTLRTSPTQTSNPVEVVLGEAGEFGAAIESYSVAASDDADGFREITVNTTAQDGAFKEQTISVIGYGKTGDGVYEGKPMSRAIKIAVRPLFKLTASCPERIENVEGAAMPLTLGLEDEIPESVFPVNVNLEAVALSLTPANGENLPVTSGKSISGSGKSAFQFVKNVSYEEYSTASTFEEEGVTYRKILCNFVTTKANSTSGVYATSPLFNTADCAFVAVEPNRFTGVSITRTLLGTGRDATLSFSMSDRTPVTIELEGATINGQTTWTYTPSAAGTQNFTLTTSTYGNQVKVTLSAEFYEVATAAGKRYTTFKANTVNSDKLPVQPCAFSGTATEANFNMNVDGNTVPFKASREVMLNTIDCTAEITTSGSSSTRYTYTITLKNYSGISYSYSTNGSSYNTVTPSSGVITISNNRNSSITLRAGKTIDGVTYYTTSTIAYNNGNTRITANDPGYKYSLTGPRTDTVIEFSGDVTATTTVPMSYTYNSRTASSYDLTVDNIATGTGAYTLSFN